MEAEEPIDNNAIVALDDSEDAEPAQLEGDDGYNTADENEHSNDNTLEPDDSAVSALRFASTAAHFEKVWRDKRKKPKERMSGKSRMEIILDKKIIAECHSKNWSLYPVVRLILPEQDSHRQFKMKDKFLADGE